MQKSGCSLCKSENPLYKKIPFEKDLLLHPVDLDGTCDFFRERKNIIKTHI